MLCLNDFFMRDDEAKNEVKNNKTTNNETKNEIIETTNKDNEIIETKNEIIETKNDYMNYVNYMNEVRNEKIGIMKKGIFAGHKDHKTGSPYAEDCFIINCTEFSGLPQYIQCRYSTFGGLYSGEAISAAKKYIEKSLKKKNLDNETVQSLKESLKFFNESKDYGYLYEEEYQHCIDTFVENMEKSNANAIKIVFDVHGFEDNFLYAAMPNNETEVVNEKIIDCLNYLFNKIINSKANKKNINIFKTACYDATYFSYKNSETDFVKNTLKNFAKGMSKAGKQVNIIYTSNFSKNHEHLSNNTYFLNYLNKYSVYDYNKEKFVSFSPDLKKIYSDEDSFDFESITNCSISFNSDLGALEEEIKKKIKEVEEEIKEVEEEIKEVEEEIKEDEKKIEEYEKKIKEDKKKIKEYRKKNEKNPILKEKMKDSLKEENDYLEKMNSSLKEKKNCLKKMNSSLREKKNCFKQMKDSFDEKNHYLKAMKYFLNKMKNSLKEIDNCSLKLNSSEEDQIENSRKIRNISYELECLGFKPPFLEIKKSKSLCKLLLGEKIYERMKETHQKKDEFLFFDIPKKIETGSVKTDLGTGNLLKIRNFLFGE